MVQSRVLLDSYKFKRRTMHEMTPSRDGEDTIVEGR
jgi:hypothetical protein